MVSTELDVFITIYNRHRPHRVGAATGELLRELTVDPTRDYQPTGAPCQVPPVPG
ncbi:hypothetical protein [Mycobacterium sp.]|uniref:hypothetical protein n=1 Tax=Mycobacterium sp. TaxID=1785 RepID=UPI002D5D97D2|nr:hypothetical protein [Mycobacterium sp.]HZA12235.1 hypothetical protein [Mycobacterium sp.]